MSAVKANAETNELVSKSEAARRWAISPSLVTRYLSRGMPVRADGRLEWATVDAWRRQNVVSGLSGSHAHRKVSGSASEKGNASFASARAKREAIAVKLAELKYKQAIGELVDRHAVERAAFDRGRAERDAWLTFPDRIAPSMAATLGVDECLLRKELRRAVGEHLHQRASSSAEANSGQSAARAER